jgi:hypothetical protein
MDPDWWKKIGPEAVKTFTGLRVARVQTRHAQERVQIHAAGNSGAGALLLAGTWGAKRVLLLGYDCQYTGGKRHWHGDHPVGMGNAGSIAKWPEQFRAVARRLPGVEIINCSRVTALDMFPRVPLEECL